MWKTIREYAEALIFAMVLAFFIRSFVIQAFKIPSGSMLPTLEIGDQLLVTKFNYGLKIPFTDKNIITYGNPEFADIIVFEYPEDPSKDFIKRVIGIPGDVIEVRDKVLYRNDKRVANEQYIINRDAQVMLETRDNFGPVTVPEGEYLTLGDNRDESYDSRFWGFVKREKIVGKAWRLYWSYDAETRSIRWNRIGKELK